MNQHEEWRPVKDYESLYEVSSAGRVRSLDRTVRCGVRGNGLRTLPGRMLKPGDDTHGYPSINLADETHGRKRVFAKIHRLVAESFLGTKPTSAHVVNHINGITTDNRVENLEWITQRQNMQHAGRTGLMLRGEKVTVSKITADDVRQIRSRRAAGEKLKSIAADFGIAESTTCQIAKGQVWKHVPMDNEPELAGFFEVRELQRA